MRAPNWMRTPAVAVAASIGMAACGPSGPYKPNADAARAACQQFIEQRVHDPASFEPQDAWKWTALEEGPGRWSIVASFRAKNGFGAVRQHAAICVVEYASDRWKLLSLSSEPR